MKRQRKKLRLPLEDGLTSYAIAATAAGMGLLALPQSADAKIVYTPINETCPCEISLRNDGIYDFAIGSSSSVKKRPGEFWGTYPVRPLVEGNRVWGISHRSLQS